MNMKLTLHCDEPIDEFDVPVEDVEPYRNLVEKHGYMDMDGIEYEYAHASVEGMEFCIYLVKKDENE